MGCVLFFCDEGRTSGRPCSWTSYLFLDVLDAYPFPGEEKKKPLKVNASELDSIVLVPKGAESEYPPPKDEDSFSLGEGQSLGNDALQVVLDWDKSEEKDGVRRFKDVVLSRQMVQDYDGLKVFKEAGELASAVPYATLRPITDGHPPSQFVTHPDQICGYIEDPRFDVESAELVATLAITNVELVGDIESDKKREVSIGFFSDMDMTGGTFGDAAYDAVQRNILIDHVAIVKDGRCSIEHGCGIKKVDNGGGPVGDKATLHAQLLSERVETITALATEIAAKASGMEVTELRSKVSQLESLTWRLQDVTDVIQVTASDSGTPAMSQAGDAIKTAVGVVATQTEALAGKSSDVPFTEDEATALLKTCREEIDAELVKVQEKFVDQEKLFTDQLEEMQETVRTTIAVDDNEPAEGRKIIDDAYEKAFNE